MSRSALPLLLAALLAACAESQPLEPALQGDSGPLFAAASRGSATVLTFAGLTPAGESWLQRNDNGVSVSIRSSGLTRGTAATLWMVIFNQPENCSPPGCGEDDLFTPEAMVDVLYTAGHVIGGAGRVTFGGHRRIGDNTGSLFAALGAPAPGLLDARAAEIHFVIRSHGPVIPRLVSEMIHTFNGGCEHPGAGFPDPLPAALGPPGPNTCVDMQFAVHLP